MRRWIGALAGALVFVSLVGDAVVSMPEPTADDMAAAAATYQRYCALCHGENREGYVNDHAPSLRSESLIASGMPLIAGMATAYGRTGTPMGAYLDEMGGPLSLSEIRTLMQWLASQVEVTPVELSFDPVTGDIAEGAEIYAASCATCHGAEGEGGTGTALGNPAMLAMTSDEFLRHAIVHGREGTPMPSFRGTLSPAEIDAVTAFLRSRTTGWDVPTPDLREPPMPGDYVLNSDGSAPDFALKDDLYVHAADLYEALRSGRRLVLLDTRVTSLWQMGHIEGAVPIPYYSSRDEVLNALPEDGTWIVAYCECPRSAAESVVRVLRDGGIENSAVLWEGFQGWVANGYPIELGSVEGAEE